MYRRTLFACALALTVLSCNDKNESPSEPEKRGSLTVRFRDDSCEHKTWDKATLGMWCQANCEWAGQMLDGTIQNDRNATYTFNNLAIGSSWRLTVTTPGSTSPGQFDITINGDNTFSLYCTTSMNCLGTTEMKNATQEQREENAR